MAALFVPLVVGALVVPAEGGMVTRLTLVIVLAVLAVSCPASAGTVTNGWGWIGAGPKVAVVGDSLTYQAEHGPVTSDPYYLTHALTDELNAGGYATRIAARSGADTRSLRMWGGWTSPPDVIVMALGTNDRRYAPVPGMIPAGFPFQLGTSQWNVVPYLNRWPTACVVMVGVTERPNRWRHDVYGPAWNRWLRYQAGLRGGVFVDWEAISRPHPEWFVADQLHHTVAGQAGYRTAITEGVNQCP